MKTIKVNSWSQVPSNYTGIVEDELQTIKNYFENGVLHCSDGSARVWNNGRKEWHLVGEFIWSSDLNKVYLKNKIVFSKTQHPEYPTVQVWKWLEKDKIKEQIVICGMEAWFME